MTLLAALIGGLVGSILTFLFGGYAIKSGHRNKLLGLLMPLVGELTTIQLFIEHDIFLIPYDFDSFQIFKSNSDVFYVVIEVLKVDGATLFGGLVHINTRITDSNNALQKRDFIIASSGVQDTFKQGIISTIDKLVSESRKGIASDISNCQCLIQNLMSELQKPLSVYSYVKSQVGIFIPLWKRYNP